MTVRTAVLVRANVPASSSLMTIGVAAVGWTWLVRSLVLYNTGAVPATPQLFIDPPAGTPGLHAIVSAQTVAAGATLTLQGFWVAKDGDIVRCTTGPAGAVRVAMWGARLLGVAP